MIGGRLQRLTLARRHPQAQGYENDFAVIRNGIAGVTIASHPAEHAHMALERWTHNRATENYKYINRPPEPSSRQRVPTFGTALRRRDDLMGPFIVNTPRRYLSK